MKDQRKFQFFLLLLPENFFGKFKATCEGLPIRWFGNNCLEDISFAPHSTDVHQNLVYLASP
jgi:hypothetical protein